MPMKNPPHPGDVIGTEIIEELGLSVSRAAQILTVRRATLSDLLQWQIRSHFRRLPIAPVAPASNTFILFPELRIVLSIAAATDPVLMSATPRAMSQFHCYKVRRSCFSPRACP